VSRVLEVIFRHPLQIILLLLIPAAIGLAIAYKLPRTYASSASLWALTRYGVIGATATEYDLTASPADTQVTALTELLQSRSFDLTIAKSTNLVATLNLSAATTSNPRLMDDALTQEISKHVVVTSTGYNVYVISYTNHDAQVAYQVVTAVIKQFDIQGETFSIAEGKQLLAGYQPQLVEATTAADASANTESQYLTAHPAIAKSGANPLSNPQYALLDARRLQAESIVQNLQSIIASIDQQIATQSANNGSFFRTLDAPLQADAAASRLKNFEVMGGAGAAIGLLACIIYIVVLVRRDRALYTPRDLQKITGYPVLMQLPQLSVATMQVLLSDDEA
jgi:hypothetical protein